MTGRRREGVEEDDDWWSARGNKYTPNTSVESLPFLQAIDTDLVGNPLTCCACL